MIFGNIRHAEEMFSWLPAPLQTALRHLKSTDFAALPCGNYDVQGKDIYVQLVEPTTRAQADTKPEIHSTYIDVHFLLVGRERIGFADDTGKNAVSEDHLADRDLLFYRAAENESFVDMVPGDFAIMFPADVHRPACQVDGPLAIRKIVMKVRASLLAKGSRA